MGGLFTKLFNYLLQLCEYLVVTLINLFIDLINLIIAALAGIFSTMLGFLPTVNISSTAPPDLVTMASHIAWFIPLSTISTCLGIIALAYVGFFSIKPILKFIHLT